MPRKKTELPQEGDFYGAAAGIGAAAEAPEAIAVGSGSDATADHEIAVAQQPLDDRAELLADIARVRALKRPFGAMTQKLALDPKPGYKTHWFNDTPGRIEDQLKIGWAHRKDEQGRPIKRIVGRARDGSGLYAYAMCIPQVIWDEMMAEKHKEAQARIDETKKNPVDSKRGRTVVTAQDEDKFYSVGRGGVGPGVTIVQPR